ncbi:MAG: hypothetical protein Hyperionvirus39_2 [Hyperionvirus sp.]|uniref:Uncharacterized protein n=1 Tax=Hyperionvirus sp. TaxID=2487770 RepID=A0A3G5ACA5_9VIRU|nr:MAG: hypothetical protein Hyperionvirus39_2 [Hyperionvirus sp.]
MKKPYNLIDRIIKTTTANFSKYFDASGKLTDPKIKKEYDEVKKNRVPGQLDVINIVPGYSQTDTKILTNDTLIRIRGPCDFSQFPGPVLFKALGVNVTVHDEVGATLTGNKNTGFLQSVAEVKSGVNIEFIGRIDAIGNPISTLSSFRTTLEVIGSSVRIHNFRLKNSFGPPFDPAKPLEIPAAAYFDLSPCVNFLNFHVVDSNAPNAVLVTRSDAVTAVDVLIDGTSNDESNGFIVVNTSNPATVRFDRSHVRRVRGRFAALGAGVISAYPTRIVTDLAWIDGTIEDIMTTEPGSQALGGAISNITNGLINGVVVNGVRAMSNLITNQASGSTGGFLYSGSDVVANVVQTNIGMISPVPSNFYGTGADGAVTINGLVTLEGNVNYTQLIITSTGRLDTNGFIVYVQTLLRIEGGVIFNGGNRSSKGREGVPAKGGGAKGGDGGIPNTNGNLKILRGMPGGGNDNSIGGYLSWSGPYWDY